MGDNPAIRININAIENTIAFKIKTECYLKILTPKTMKLLGSTEIKIIKIKMVKICLIWKSLKKYQLIVILLAIIINAIQEFCIPLFQITHLVNYQKFPVYILYFKVWFADQNYKAKEIEDKTYTTLFIN